ncbi:MAG: Gfo/Idh/MocA family oxidoreductase, partial [Lentisphaerae bacterium]|nr:Gfo/Idh/MocA family oxidoreductase [Lentisphaerota bacterium]
MMKTLRVGIIGQGRSGRDIHAEYLKTCPEQFKIVAVCDLLQDRCERAEKEYGCATYQDYREMINDKSLQLDFVVNSSFSHLHAPISKEIML